MSKVNASCLSRVTRHRDHRNSPWRFSDRKPRAPLFYSLAPQQQTMSKDHSSSYHSSSNNSSSHDPSHEDPPSHHHRGGAEPEIAGDPVEEQAAKVEPPPASCWERLLAEINPCRPWFLKTQPAHDRPLDITSAFAPEGCQPLFFKVFCGAFVWGTAIFSIVKDRKDRGFW